MKILTVAASGIGISCVAALSFGGVPAVYAGSILVSVQIIKDLDKNITDRHVIIVEDIIDSGLTLQYLTDLFKSRKPASVRTLLF